MCLAILNYKSTIPLEHFENAAWTNRDGMGILWSDGISLHVHKQLDDVELFYSKYREIREATPYPIAIHFRMSTHGTINLDNCHPFLVHDDLGFIHNGIFDFASRDGKSDTVLFNEEVLQQLPANFVTNQGIAQLLEDYVGNFNKLVFLRSDGASVIYGEKNGSWDGDTWYSNCGYKSYSNYSSYQPKYSASQSYGDDFWGETDEWERDVTTGVWKYKGFSEKDHAKKVDDANARLASEPYLECGAGDDGESITELISNAVLHAIKSGEEVPKPQLQLM